MFEQATSADPRNVIVVTLFQQIGVGQRFCYYTDVVEVLGGLLVLIPRMVTAGLALLVCTVASAALILASFLLYSSSDCPFIG